MNLHNIISQKIVSYLDFFYYKYLKKLYNNNLTDITKSSTFIIIKPEYFIFLQYYLIYSFFYYITNKNSIQYSISLDLIYICDKIYDHLVIKYNYIPLNNIIFLVYV